MAKTNVIMRDFIVDDIGVQSPQETMQSIIFLNVYKGNILSYMTAHFKLLLDFDLVDSMSKSY